jgi:hypothetical protein
MKHLLLLVALVGTIGLWACDETSCSDECDNQCAAVDCSCLSETNGECECEGCG